MIPKRDPYPLIENVPEHIVIRARQMVAKRVNPEAKWFYMQGKGDHYTVVQAVIEALMESERIQSVAHPPRRDGKQPGSVASDRPSPVQAAPFQRASATKQRAHVIPQHEVGAIFRGHPDQATVHNVGVTAGETAPFPIPQASSSQATAGNSAMSAVTRVPPLSFHEDPCLSAQLAMGIR